VAQIRHCADLLTRHANLFQKTHAETAPCLFRSLFTDPCVERGRDIKRSGRCTTTGSSSRRASPTRPTASAPSTGSSFGAAASRCRSSWPSSTATGRGRTRCGPRRPRAQVRQRDARGGRSGRMGERRVLPPPADAEDLARRVVLRRRDRLQPRDRLRAAPGRQRRRSPLRRPGRRQYRPLPGRDTAGPTAMLRSVAQLPQALGTSAMCLNLKLSPASSPGRRGSPMRRPSSRHTSASGAATAGQRRLGPDAAGGPEGPANHGHVIVRVGGFCARFIDLDAAQQEDIIARTTQVV